MMASTELDSPFGSLLAVASDAGLRALLWPDDTDRVKLPEHRADPDHPVLVSTREQLREYFAGTRAEFDLPLDPIGTEFQRRVWAGLTRISFGETSSYGQLAQDIGRPRAVRAVGAANGKNPISIVVPCHRVIGADGSLTGFAGGLDAKRMLLELEGSVV